MQQAVKLRQIYKSLATADRREAIIRARLFATRTDELFGQIPHMAKKQKGEIDFGLITTADVQLNRRAHYALRELTRRWAS